MNIPKLRDSTKITAVQFLWSDLHLAVERGDLTPQTDPEHWEIYMELDRWLEYYGEQEDAA